jgi:hypothetical protein
MHVIVSILGRQSLCQPAIRREVSAAPPPVCTCRECTGRICWAWEEGTGRALGAVRVGSSGPTCDSSRRLPPPTPSPREPLPLGRSSPPLRNFVAVEWRPGNMLKTLDTRLAKVRRARFSCVQRWRHELSQSRCGVVEARWLLRHSSLTPHPASRLAAVRPHSPERELERPGRHP